MEIILRALLGTIAKLPLSLLHNIGNILGNLAFYIAHKDRARIRDNLRTAQLPNDDAMIKRVLQETAKGGLELPIAFFRQPEAISALFREVHGWEYIEQAIEKQQGLLLITPHLGSYDLAGRYISERLPFELTAMYKPPKLAAMNNIMQAGRQRGKGRTAPTNIQGVKQIMKALRQGEATIVLPDHVPDPAEGEGVWVKFFGRDALTMTLASKLAQVKNVCPLFFVGERLAEGKGFALHIAPLSGSLNGDKAHDTQIINDNVEHWIRRFPEQYLFAYNRYKDPTGQFVPNQ
ncbi:lysophospholipid acyltransferase family protein [Neisseriaceae bacterium B1]